jgi:hypothetical protein
MEDSECADLTQITQEEITLLQEPSRNGAHLANGGGVADHNNGSSSSSSAGGKKGGADPNSTAWGSLKRRDGGQEMMLLNSRTGIDRAYTLGRADACDVNVGCKSVSKLHCAIYCEYHDARMKVYLRGISPHGTYVNNAFVRLAENQMYELKTGDDIYLVNPMTSSPANINISTFMFVNLWERMTYQRAVASAPLATIDNRKSAGPSSSSSSSASSNSIRSRLIEDYFIVGDQIGFGMCGQVHMCVQKTSGQYYVSILWNIMLNRGLG